MQSVLLKTSSCILIQHVEKSTGLARHASLGCQVMTGQLLVREGISEWRLSPPQIGIRIGIGFRYIYWITVHF